MPRKQTIAMQKESSVLWNQMYSGGRNKHRSW